MHNLINHAVNRTTDPVRLALLPPDNNASHQSTKPPTRYRRRLLCTWYIFPNTSAEWHAETSAGLFAAAILSAEPAVASGGIVIIGQFLVVGCLALWVILRGPAVRLVANVAGGTKV